jgi:hypothetical protein
MVIIIMTNQILISRKHNNNYNNIFHYEYNMIKLILSIDATTFKQRPLVKMLEIIKKEPMSTNPIRK